MKNKITSFFQVSKSSNKRNNSNISAIVDDVTSAQEKHQNDDTKANATNTSVIGDVDGIVVTPTIHKKTKLLDDKNDDVQQLLMYLNDNNDSTEQQDPSSTLTHASTNTSIEKHSTTPTISWKDVLQKHFNSTSFYKLANFIAIERKKYTIYPPIQHIWTTLNICTLHNVKVVIVGQDPYHGYNQAHGLSFSVLPNCPIPPSLKNIYKELMNDPNIHNFNTIPNHGYLIKWVQQGVLLLNTVLTVRHQQPNSHQNYGWENVTDEIIRIIVQYHCCSTNTDSNTDDKTIDNNNSTNNDSTIGNDATYISQQQSKKGGCVFLLWGKPATKKAMNVIESVMKQHDNNNTNNTDNTKKSNKKTYEIICTSHPSPLGATKTSSPFLGSHCFSRCNDALIQMGHEPIDWNV